MANKNHSFLEKYCVNMLQLKNSGNGVDRIGSALFGSKIKLTPHQIQAALFAFDNPLNKGVLLADEVGLGKTIEAGIILSQLWNEGKTRMLIVAPASLMRQWSSELYDKFHLDSFIMDRKMYNQRKVIGYENPFKNAKSIIICSYQMCSASKDDIYNAGFDYVIVDEAHKLRNVHNEKTVMANNVKFAISRYKKALLTATPIQNNLMDVYGLSTVIDENIFGDKEVFRFNYIKNYDENYRELEHRLDSFTHRTLRNQVEQYIRFTKRIPQTFKFTQTDDEKRLYEEIVSLMQDEVGTKYIIPNSQRHLLLLVLCKLMGSSVSSVIGTMETIKARLEKIQESNVEVATIEAWDFDDLDDEEYEDEESTEEKVDFVELAAEIERVKGIIALAEQVKIESKYIALKDALAYSFNHLRELGANEKVIIFTESKRTQMFLKEQLVNDGYEGVLTYNGSNSDDESRSILKEWEELPSNVDKLNNSRSVNMRAAILHKFETDGSILIATEAGAEGLNLQFCSLVINYDLPWNPQRVEQRIGRCHRFGQKYDVVVINFINSNNIVENRVYELLDSKFHLFEEVFGSSDEILGKLNDGKDIEDEIVNIYLSCRTDEEINRAFDDLQEKYKDDIESTLESTKNELLEHFDEDVQKLFENVLNSAIENMSKIEQLFWRLTKAVLDGKASFDEEKMTFKYGFPEREYCMLSRNEEDSSYIDYGLNTNLGLNVIAEAKKSNAEFGHIVFDLENYKYNLSKIEQHKGHKGILSINKLIIKSFEEEEHIFLNGIWEDGTRIEQDVLEKLLRLDMLEEYYDGTGSISLYDDIREDVKIHSNQIVQESQEKNNAYLNEEVSRINAWADDKIQSTQLSVENLREQRKALQKESDQATNMADKQALEEEIQRITKKIKRSWVLLAEAEEEVEDERKRLIDSIRKENMKEWSVEHIFTVNFEIK